MEVSFRHLNSAFSHQNKMGFNPCFNGSIFQTQSPGLSQEAPDFVSILVLMEVSFRHCIGEVTVGYYVGVSILVLMEVSFRLSLTTTSGHSHRCFNPCFNGSIFQTLFKGKQIYWINTVSILVLMEVSFRPLSLLSIPNTVKRFNPCFNGSIFQTPASHPSHPQESGFQSLF